MKVELEGLGAAPPEYKQSYFANMVRAIEAAMRRIDYAPVFDPEVQRTDDVNPSKVLYSTGGIKLDEQFEPDSPEDVMPKKYVDAIDAALQEALATLDAARLAAEASLQESVDTAQSAADTAQSDVDDVKADAALVTYDPSGATNLTETNVQDVITEAVEDSSLLVFAGGTSSLTQTNVEGAIIELAEDSAKMDFDTTESTGLLSTNVEAVIVELEDRIIALEP